MIQFFAPDIEVTPILPESDSQHCVKVLRKRLGDTIDVIDGKGYRYVCRIVDPHHKHTMVEVVEKIAQPLPWQHDITIAVAPTKHIDRMEWLVEKLVEVGVDRIVPLRCRYSERKEIKVDRLQKIAVAAMKQSLKAVLPRIDEMTPFADFINSVDTQQRFIAYCAEGIPRRELTHIYNKNTSVCVLIGPEGDFSEEEIRGAFECGFQPVTLGDNRLRTETAALYACTAFHVLDSLIQR